MGALSFDPYAVLAEIQNQKPTPATPPTVPTHGAKTGSTGQTVGGVGTIEGGHPQISKSEQQPKLNTGPTDSDPEIYLAHLREHGFSPYGAMATALGWGATRAWQAEAKLRASGRIVRGEAGLRLAEIVSAPPENTSGEQA